MEKRVEAAEAVDKRVREAEANIESLNPKIGSLHVLFDQLGPIAEVSSGRDNTLQQADLLPRVWQGCFIVVFKMLPICSKQSPFYCHLPSRPTLK